MFPCLQFMTLFKETGQVLVVQFLGEVMNETVWLCPTLCANIPVCRTQSRSLMMLYGTYNMTYTKGRADELVNFVSFSVIRQTVEGHTPLEVVQITGEVINE